MDFGETHSYTRQCLFLTLRPALRGLLHFWLPQKPKRGHRMEAIDPWQITTGALAMLAGALVYVGKAQVALIEAHTKQLADHSDRITRAEERMLTFPEFKAEISEVEKRITDAITGMDRHHTATAARIEAIAQEAHRKADELRRDISGA